MTQKPVNVVIVVGSAVWLSDKPAFSIFNLFTTRSKYCNLLKNSVIVLTKDISTKLLIEILLSN